MHHEECDTNGCGQCAEEELDALRAKLAALKAKVSCGDKASSDGCGECRDCLEMEIDRLIQIHESTEGPTQTALRKAGEQVTELRHALCGNDRRLALLAKKHDSEALSAAETDELDRLHQQVAAMFPRTPDVDALTARVAELEHHLSEVLLRLDYELDGFPRALEPAVAACKAAHKALNELADLG